MFSKNTLFLALGLAGLALFSVRGKVREKAAAGEDGQNREDPASGEDRNRNLPSTITFPLPGAPSA